MMEPEKLELLLLIFKTLDKNDSGPYRKVADTLKDALEKDTGNLTKLLTHYPNLKSSTLEEMLLYLKRQLDKHIPTGKHKFISYLGAGQYSLLRSEKSLYRDDVQHSINTLLSYKHYGPGYKNHSVNIAKHLQARSLRGPVCIRKSLPTEIHKRTKLYRKLMGHLSSVYCVCFDQTGQFIFTGADDHLIKIWSATDGRLLKTLRGHDGEITDMSVNYENRLLASGGMDKVIRIWDLKTSRLLECLIAHNATVTSVKFAPYNRHDNFRYLISTSNDGTVIFWQYDADKFNFKRHHRARERSRPGGQITCCSFSTGGSFLACGSSDNCVHVYGFDPVTGPYSIVELDYHENPVDSIQFSNHGFRFISGSQDGTAVVWSYKRGKFEPLKLDMLTQLDQKLAEVDPKTGKPRVLIVQWSSDDRFVMTSLIDFSIKVWDSNTGKLLYILKEHKHDIYLIESHPVDHRIFVSASHDGTMIIWDLERAKVLKKFYNRVENPENPDGTSLAQIYDLKFSPDGNMIASTDSYGYLSIYGNGSSDRYKPLPEQLFFHTDYRALIRDGRHFVMDEQTHVAPHLMPKPVLVDMNGNPYPHAFQRFVPDYRSGERYIIAPLSDNKLKEISENISAHSENEDEEFLFERDYYRNILNDYEYGREQRRESRRESRREPKLESEPELADDDSDSATIEDTDDATQIDSDNTEIDDLTEIDEPEPERQPEPELELEPEPIINNNHHHHNNPPPHHEIQHNRHDPHRLITNPPPYRWALRTRRRVHEINGYSNNNSSGSSSSSRRLNGNDTGSASTARRRHSARIRDRKRFRRM